jgi:hypothetical protein
VEVNETPEPASPDSLTPAEAKAKLAELEKAKMTRREAFGRIGFRAAATAIAALSADDLLRAVGREMERRNFDSEVAQNVATEFKNAGAAFAEAPDPSPLPCTCSNPPTGYKCKSCFLGGKMVVFDCATSACCDTRYQQCLNNGTYPHSECSSMYHYCQTHTT